MEELTGNMCFLMKLNHICGCACVNKIVSPKSTWNYEKEWEKNGISQFGRFLVLLAETEEERGKKSVKL